MLMLAVPEQSGATVPRSTPGLDAGASISTSDLAAAAQRLSEAIGHHRAEGRRHAADAKKHRGQMRDLLQQRNQHIAKLSAGGWSASRIAALYLVSSERIGQIVRAALGTDVDDGAEVA